MSKALILSDKLPEECVKCDVFHLEAGVAVSWGRTQAADRKPVSGVLYSI